MKYLGCLFVALCLSLNLGRGCLAEEKTLGASFLPVWKLLSPDQKRTFIAGYIQGWHDAGKLTDIAVAYVKENPKSAVEGLEQIKSIYDLSDLKPETLAQALDEYYANPDHMGASLSLAVTAVKSGR